MRGVVALCAALLLSLSVGALAASPAQAEQYDLFGSLLTHGSDPFHATPSLPHQQRIAVEHSTGNIFVANIVDDRIDVYRPSAYGGRVLTSFGSGELSDPFGIAVDQATGAVYVSDAGNGRIVRYTVAPGTPPVYTLDGGFTGPAAGSGTGEIGNFAAALAIDNAAGKLLVADPGNNQVKRFTLAGAYDNLAFDGADAPPAHVGDLDGHFTGLLDLAVDSTGDIVVIDALGNIADGTGDSRVLRFGSAGVYESQIGPSLSRPANVGVRPTDDEVFVTWDQDNVNVDGIPKLSLFTSSDTADGPITFSTDKTVTNINLSVTTGVALDDGPLGRLYLATDFDRSSYEGRYGTWSVQALTPPTSPLVSDEVASVLRPTTASITAGIYSGRGQATYHFEYGIVGQGYTQSTPTEQLKPLQTASIKAYLTGLQPNTDYQFRVVADNGTGGPSVSGGATFTTEPALPVVTIGEASDVTLDGAVLHGQIDTQGFAAIYGFAVAQVGESQRVTLPAASLPAGNGAVAVAAPVSGLARGRSYTVRLYARTAAGTTFADPVTFTTAPGAVFTPAPPPGADEHPYGCAAPRLNVVGAAVKAGQSVTVTGTDLGSGGGIALGTASPLATAWSSGAVSFTVPDGSEGTLPLTVNCGTVSNTVGLVVRGVPDNRAAVAKVTVAGSSARVSVQAPGAGTIRITGKNIAAATGKLTKAATKTITVKLTAAGKKALAKVKSRKLAVTISVRFTPTGGSAATTTKKVTFTRGSQR